MTIRRASHEGVNYSVVETGGVRHLFAVAIPQSGTTLREQTLGALRAIDIVIRSEGTQGSIVQQSVFVSHVNDIAECRQIIAEFYEGGLPATSYIPQRPCQGQLVAIEAMAVGAFRDTVQIERISEQLVVARHGGITAVYCANIVSNDSFTSVYDQTTAAFGELAALLKRVDFQFNQVVRTWLYLGGIVDSEGPVQRYTELNRARSDVYRDIPFLADRLPHGQCGPVFPASTAIGVDGRGLSISAIALASDRDDIVAVPLENPRQTAAYDYASHYSPESPKFSRAVALCMDASAVIFVSGTASITQSETRHVDDAAAQTDETLNNIEALISEENFCRHGRPGSGSSLADFGIVRVYIKKQEDFAVVSEICRRRLGQAPIIYAVADVCRPELVVEIEGIALSRRA